MIEEWRAVVGYEGRYEVSDLGSIRRLHQQSTDKRRNRNAGKLLMPQRRGIYQAVHLHRPEIKTHAVHTLVLTAFVGVRPEGMQCRHLDGDSRNNRLTNLAWGTPLENHNDKRAHGTTATGGKHKNSKLKPDQVREIKSSKERGVDLAKRFGVTETTISGIRHNKGWQHIQCP